MIRRTLIICCVLLAWPALPATADENWDATYYWIDLTVDPAAETIVGVTWIRAEAVSGGVSSLVLDLVDLTVNGVVEIGSGSRPYTHKGGLLTITLSRPYSAGEEVELNVSYSGSPTAGVNFHPAQNLVYTYGWDNLSRHWFPCFDHPSDKADNCDITITVPAGMIVAANGLLQSTTRRGQWEAFHWHHGYPITTYNICFHASDYAQFTQYFGAVPIDYYVYPDDLADAQASFQNIPAMMTYFESVFGPYPFPGEKMGFAEAQLSGGMEHQTMVTIGSAFINGGTFWETLYAHEAAHMWWGDCVSIATWADFWLSEGFASYGDALWQEGGYGVWEFQDRMGDFRDSYFSEDAGNRFPVYDPAVPLSSTVYDKGAWIVHMLRRVFDDDEAFFTMLQDYRAASEHGNVTTAQFQAAAEAGLGESLDWFFQQWVYMAGYPEYEYDWSWNDGTMTLVIDQVQPVGGVTPLFTAEVDLWIFTSAGDQTITVLVDEAHETFELDLPGRPIDVDFDYNLWLLCKAEKVNGSTARAFAAPGPDQANSCVATIFDLEGNDGITISPYGVDAWGANVACGDLDGDRIDELLTGPGPGAVFGPHVRAFSASGAAIPGVSFLAYGTNKFGVNVSTGDIDGDGMDEIVTGAGPGAVFGPHVRGWNVDGGPAMAMAGVSYFAYGTPKWGVNVACGDIDADGHDEIVTGAGPGTVYGPHVRGWNVDGGSAAAMPAVSFFAYGTLKYGVNVTCGDVDADGIDEIITGAGPGRVFASHVRAFDHDGGSGVIPHPYISFFAFDNLYRYGARVGMADLDGDGAEDIIVGPGPDATAPGRVRVFSWTAGGLVEEVGGFTAFPDAIRGTSVAGGRL